MQQAVEAMEGAVEEGKAAEARLEEELRAAMGRAALSEASYFGLFFSLCSFSFPFLPLFPFRHFGSILGYVC